MRLTFFSPELVSKLVSVPSAGGAHGTPLVAVKHGQPRYRRDQWRVPASWSTRTDSLFGIAVHLAHLRGILAADKQFNVRTYTPRRTSRTLQPLAHSCGVLLC